MNHIFPDPDHAARFPKKWLEAPRAWPCDALITRAESPLSGQKKRLTRAIGDRFRPQIDRAFEAPLIIPEHIFQYHLICWKVNVAMLKLLEIFEKPHETPREFWKTEQWRK